VQLSRRAVPAPDGTVRDVEILVLYPSDGYWRAKPLPPATLADSAFGSSFLFGPVEMDGRPYVAIREVAFDPATLRFDLAFRDGSRGSLAVTEATRSRVVLAAAFDAPTAGARPFAALRSMFVDPLQADVAFARALPAAHGAAEAAPILAFDALRAPGARFGRSEPSRHNLSAPDMVFDRFVASAPADRPRR
jgi:hypothetical protein